MQSTELSLAGKLDTGLTKGLCLLFGWLKSAALWLFGLLMLAALPNLIFEYGEGLSDLSWAEWAFILLMLLLIWRHILYSRHFATGFWGGLNRLLMFQGRLTCLFFILGGIVFGFEDAFDSTLEGNNVSVFFTGVEYLGFILLAVYLAAPTASLTNAVARPATAQRIEPTFSSAAKEASQ